MAKAVEVARFLAYLAANDVEPDYLTNLRLQKLLYYVQAWSLVLRKSADFFQERIEAWVHGPVVREKLTITSRTATCRSWRKTSAS